MQFSNVKRPNPPVQHLSLARLCETNVALLDIMSIISAFYPEIVLNDRPRTQTTHAFTIS
jgi:hypothetical protein